MARRKTSDTPNGKSLVIVESPAKARTINKYLGPQFVVKASMGHVRDLPQRQFGIDVTDNFRPSYEVLRSRSKVLNELRRLAGDASAVYLATDRDREGEAIAWHLVEALELPPGKARRVIFNEITRAAIAEAFRHPHELDLDRVNAQQARRILDRIVGYELSPLLWRKIARGLSAGRVQSVAVRLIVDREREIRAFRPEESWKINAYVTGEANVRPALREQWAEFIAQERTQKDVLRWLSEHGAFRAELVEVAGEPFKAGNVEVAKAVAEALGFRVERVEREAWAEYKHLGLEQVRLVGAADPAAAARLAVADLTTRRTTTRPSAPFTTASLQQAASTALRFSTSRTMRVAQALYEGIDLNGEGPVGLITYMRTDSTNLAAEAVAAVREFIRKSYGQQYLPDEPNVYGKRQERAQEAHEAIRPTDVAHTPEGVRKRLTDEQFKLYDLIWRRFVACQMPPAEWDSTTVTLTCETARGPAKFTGNGRKLVFDGFMRVTGVTSEDQILPALRTGAPVGLIDLEPKQQFTSPPPRYTEASLVKALEAEGIGRPSTYAAIIETIQDRGYVEQADRKFYPTALGELVTDKLVEHFPKIMDVKFTSYMEDELDKIEDAHLDWVHVLHEFYDPFKELLARAGQEMEAARSQPSDYTCPDCGQPMVYRWSRTGRFLACSAYPHCKATLNVNREGRPVTGPAGAHACELCGKPMTLRQSRSGFFLGCTGYPECRSTVPCDETGTPLKQAEEEELTRPCDACGEGKLTVRWKRNRAFLGCDHYPRCKNTASVPEGVYVRKKPAPPPQEAGVACDQCGRPMVIRSGSRGRFIACSGFPGCRNTKPIERLEELRARSPATATPSVQPPGAPETPRPTRRSKRGPSAAHTAGARAAAARPAAGGATSGGSNALGAPPSGFAWTRTGRPVVETLPEDGTLHCPQCGSPMELKRGRFGPFFSCRGFPRCRFVANLRGQARKDAEELLPAPARPKPIPTEIACEACGSPMLVREGRTGKFLGCSAYPKCKSTQELPPGFKLPEPEPAGAAT